MSTYVDGYRAGWSSYLEDCKSVKHSVQHVVIEVRLLAEKARQALPPQQQGDYWLGYHHGRAAAKTCVSKHG